MKYKAGVLIVPNYQYQFVCDVVDRVWRSILGHEAMMTSGCERFDDAGNVIGHRADSQHWQFLAWDFRIYNNNDPRQGKIDKNTLPVIVEELKENLGAMFDVVLESSHIHIEYDPKI